MSTLIPEVIVAGLAAAVSPLAIMALISVMFLKKPVRNALLYFTGFTLTLVTIGVVALLVMHAGSAKRGAVGAYIDIALGVLCLAFVPLVMRGRKREKAPLKDVEMKPLKAFGLGILMMVTNESTFIIYVAGVQMIVASKVGVSGSIVALAVMTFLTLTTLMVPIALYIIFPQKAKKLLDRAGGWLARHGRVIGAGILVIFGVYLLANGINTLV